MVIVQHYAHSAKHYAEAIPFPGVLFLVPRICPDCGAIDVLIRWGTYTRQACTGLEVYWIQVQRVRCKACKHTHSLLPDFLHPYRRYVIARMQLVIYLLSWPRSPSVPCCHLSGDNGPAVFTKAGPDVFAQTGPAVFGQSGPLVCGQTGP